MDKERDILAILLSAAIRGQDAGKIDFEEIDWTKVYEEAKAHEVHTIIYPAVKNLHLKNMPDKGLMDVWKRESIISQAQQIQHICRVGEVIRGFNAAGIPVIALKGMVLRNLYPNPELRTMGDADLLVRREDIKAARKLLLGMGYYIRSSDSKHIHFSHEYPSDIELHTRIVDYEKIKNLPHLEGHLWENAEQFSVDGAAALKLSREDEILYLCLHMILHIKLWGFGLRQLCDLVLAVNAGREKIDWESFYNRCRNYGIYEFVNAVFTICRNLLNKELPPLMGDVKPREKGYIDMLVDYIFEGGAYGGKTNERGIAVQLMNLSNGSNQKKLCRRIINLLLLAFPSPKKLSNKYAYARKYPILAPAAWIHRFVYCIIRVDLTPSQKKDYLIPTGAIKDIMEERARLLEWLQLP